MRRAKVVSLVLLVLLSCWGAPAHAARVKDIAHFLGMRPNPLSGYGLVVGLNGTGDNQKTLFTVNTLANLLDNSGIHVDPTQVKVKNVAAVMVTARLTPFARNGARLDVQVSSIGDAKSIQGGTLLMAPLQGPDGQVWAVAQGPVSVGGFDFSGSSGTSVQKNHPTVGFIAEGATVEREMGLSFDGLTTLDLALQSPDFTTAGRVAERVNEALGGPRARARDAVTISIEVPPDLRQRIPELIATIESLPVTPDAVARIVINERTGTVVMGENVRVSAVAVAHGSLTVQISEQPEVSQPLPFSRGKTAVVPRTKIEVQEEKGALHVVNGGASIGQVVKGLNAIGATPRDLINILQAIRAAGALQAEIEII